MKETLHLQQKINNLKLRLIELEKQIKEPQLVTPDGIGFVKDSESGNKRVNGIVNDKKILKWSPLRNEWYIGFKDGNHIAYNLPFQETTFGELKEGDVFCDDEIFLDIGDYNIKKGGKGIYWLDEYPNHITMGYDQRVYKVMPK